MTAQEYLTEPILWGGLPSTRAEIIRTLQKQGTPQRCVDYHLIGLDQSRERNKEAQP